MYVNAHESDRDFPVADAVTIKDIARLAGVSIGTVDRVLHNRGRVAEATKSRILGIIRDTGFKPNLFASNLAQSRNYRIGVLTPGPDQDSGFWQLPHRGMQTAAEELSAFSLELLFHCFDRFSPDSFRTAAEELLTDTPDGILLAPILPEPAEEFARKLPEDLPLCCFDSDLPEMHKLTYIGQDPRMSGRLAAKLMRMLVPPEMETVIIQAVNLDDHIRGREEGFRSYYPKDKKPPVLEEVHLDSKDTCFAFLDSLFSRNPGIGGFFVANASVHRVAEYLSQHGRTDIALIGYDLIPRNREYLEQGIIDFLISQRPETQGYLGIQTLFRALNRQPVADHHVVMPIDILTAENIHYYTTFEPFNDIREIV
ncbi:substrate-binding domain-containing protein [Marispirochaeta aestuarii]|uniref:LacI family DNA-binding transcriptional regulator n=1 Tax=Marispirochaeta aestuarii TaxID=1963862 RepID=UPI0029C8A765|nr:substrate-binding domain-containing protein [Marispirochaeta aestuarii]